MPEFLSELDHSSVLWVILDALYNLSESLPDNVNSRVNLALSLLKTHCDHVGISNSMFLDNLGFIGQSVPPGSAVAQDASVNSQQDSLVQTEVVRQAAIEAAQNEGVIIP